MQALPDDCLPADITEPGSLMKYLTRWMLTMMGKLPLTMFKAAMTRDSSLKDVVLSSLRPL
ncbi:unnamed protein product [Rhodiola kirilowii]